MALNVNSVIDRLNKMMQEKLLNLVNKTDLSVTDASALSSNLITYQQLSYETLVTLKQERDRALADFANYKQAYTSVMQEKDIIQKQLSDMMAEHRELTEMKQVLELKERQLSDNTGL